jgi:(E)-4-hydroxy-3-methylbut-2-enyl-diphosphate synthase
MAILLEEGIGNTIRVSLSGPPVEEVKAGWQILKAMNLRQRGVNVVACPTCARSGIDVAKICKEIEEKTSKIKAPYKIAVMGCAVNGPGEAKEADIGVVGGKDKALMYKKGEKSSLIDNKDIVKAILEEIKE